MDNNTIKVIDKIKNIINKVYPISEKSFMEIGKLLEIEKYTKGETFISKNKKNDKEYFVLNGICKSYLINPAGEEITISFFVDETVLSPYSIRTPNGISNQNFKALTNIELASINAKEFANLMTTNIEIKNFAHTVLQNELISKVEKEIGLASLSAKERLLEFRKKYRFLENLIPHTHIASYLGITNISLSRLRKDISI